MVSPDHKWREQFSQADSEGPEEMAQGRREEAAPERNHEKRR